ACLSVERGKNAPAVELNIIRAAAPPRQTQPPAAGPWRLVFLDENREAPPPRPDRLILPARLAPSRRLWAGESLLLSAIAAHLTPPPGAPETRGGETLVLESILPAAPVASILAGAAAATLICDETTAQTALATARLNGRAQALNVVVSAPADSPAGAARKISAGAGQRPGLNKNAGRGAPAGAARQTRDWDGRFSLIAVHLSPYLVARRLAAAARWLAPDGVLIISGFAPGPQTASLLRAAAKAGLYLLGSINEGDWAAMKLARAPEREELPPLDVHLTPTLEEMPPEPSAAPDDGQDEIPDEESLLTEEEEPEEDFY
ncbi:MAG: hypothetical protein LBS31_10860, partial [Candidatus Adiutrix sp.]|nr:hypothetical protein [Candidatus Adiutrix sp.]